MKMHSNNPGIICLLAFSLATGCSLANKNGMSAKTKKDILFEKKKQHDQLYTELIQKAIQQGTTAAQIRKKFGEPDDIFKSGSSTGSFDIWTYDKILLSKDDKIDWDAILLYFNNDRLITWKY